MRVNAKELREYIRLIVEDLGKVQVRGFKGYGASHPIQTRAEKFQLGKLEIPHYDADTSDSLVKVSRAFTPQKETSED